MMVNDGHKEELLTLTLYSAHCQPRLLNDKDDGLPAGMLH